MIHLNSGSGSAEVQLTHPLESFEEWAELRSNVLRFLRARGHERAAKLLDSMAFDIIAATNSFNDDFEILYIGVSPEEYARYEKLAAERWERVSFNQIADAVTTIGKRYIRFIVVDIDFGDRRPVPSPNPKITSGSVEMALADAEQLLLSRGAESAVDRVHTALHTYLRALCQESNIAVDTRDGLTALFKKLRSEHPKLAVIAADPNVVRIVGSLANIMDALNAIWNHHSMAHPNEQLLGRPEATLIINASRSILHFIDDKLAG